MPYSDVPAAAHHSFSCRPRAASRGMMVLSWPEYRYNAVPLLLVLLVVLLSVTLGAGGLALAELAVAAVAAVAEEDATAATCSMFVTIVCSSTPTVERGG